METFDRGVEMLVHLDFVAVKLEFRAVKQCLIPCKSRNDLVDGLNEVDDVEHGSIRHCRRYIAGYRVFERRANVGETEFSLPRALARQYISVTLNEDFARAKHICEFADLLSVFYRLFERFGKGMRAKNREVCIFALLLLVTVSVDDCEVVVIVLLRDKSARVLAEYTHFVLERSRITDEFALIEHFVDFLHNLVADFDSDADVDNAGRVRDIVLCAHLFEPFRSSTSSCDYGLVGIYLLLVVPF